MLDFNQTGPDYNRTLFIGFTQQQRLFDGLCITAVGLLNRSPKVGSIPSNCTSICKPNQMIKVESDKPEVIFVQDIYSIVLYLMFSFKRSHLFPNRVLKMLVDYEVCAKHRETDLIFYLGLGLNFE